MRSICPNGGRSRLPSPSLPRIDQSFRMRLPALLLFMLVCLIWAGNIIVSRILFADYAIPPVYYAAIRFLIIGIVLSPLLLPLPRPLAPTLIIGLLMGAVHFGLMFVGLSTSSANGMAVILQISIPTTAILSMIFLGERLSPVQIVGVALACSGVFTVL
jgi:O-acetylserine/cysteine efflux transporter